MMNKLETLETITAEAKRDLSDKIREGIEGKLFHVMDSIAEKIKEPVMDAQEALIIKGTQLVNTQDKIFNKLQIQADIRKVKETKKADLCTFIKNEEGEFTSDIKKSSKTLRPTYQKFGK